MSKSKQQVVMKTQFINTTNFTDTGYVHYIQVDLTNFGNVNKDAPVVSFKHPTMVRNFSSTDGHIRVLDRDEKNGVFVGELTHVLAAGDTVTFTLVCNTNHIVPFASLPKLSNNTVDGVPSDICMIPQNLHIMEGDLTFIWDKIDLDGIKYEIDIHGTRYETQDNKLTVPKVSLQGSNQFTIRSIFEDTQYDPNTLSVEQHLAPTTICGETTAHTDII